ncbi:MAG: hypothetical protein V4450_07455 [Bacteroidota bacterium]
MPLNDLRNTIAKMGQFDWEAEMIGIVSRNTDTIEKMQREQLYSGVDSNNARITLLSHGERYDQYAANTIFGIPYLYKGKIEKGQPIDRITWSDTGGLYAALEAKLNKREVALTAPGEDEKYSAMMQRSGKATVGLNEQRREQFGTDVTLPEIKTIYKQKTTFEIT